MKLAELHGFYLLANNDDAAALISIMSRAKKVNEGFRLQEPTSFYFKNEDEADLRPSITLYEYEQTNLTQSAA
jgi:hypothetical protein